MKPVLLDVSLDHHSHLKYENNVQNIIIKTERYDLYINYFINQLISVQSDTYASIRKSAFSY